MLFSDTIILNYTKNEGIEKGVSGEHEPEEMG